MRDSRFIMWSHIIYVHCQLIYRIIIFAAISITSRTKKPQLFYGDAGPCRKANVYYPRPSCHDHIVTRLKGDCIFVNRFV